MRQKRDSELYSRRHTPSHTMQAETSSMRIPLSIPDKVLFDTICSHIAIMARDGTGVGATDDFLIPVVFEALAENFGKLFA